MATTNVKSSVSIDLKINLELSYEEARALLSITSYGADNYLRAFYSNLGKNNLQPHEKGLRSLFETLKGNLNNSITRADYIMNTAINLNRS